GQTSARLGIFPVLRYLVHVSPEFSPSIPLRALSLANFVQTDVTRQFGLMEYPVAKARGTAFARPRQVDDAGRHDFSCRMIVPQAQHLSHIVQAHRHRRNSL